ncbi:MAG: efflux RND transporter periplasmic adaptor subunit [Proteobacteria bacterium]|nr:efflux RND transporter periplasmic adaptor subunit [Pseudomonadota bacterium]
MRSLVLFVLLGLLAGCERAEPPVVDQAIRPAKLFQVSARQVSTTHDFVGRLDAAQTVDVSFEVDGEIVQLPVREGQAIAKGELIASLDPTDFQLAVKEAEVQLRLATQDMQRKTTLLRERGISESIVDDARAVFELAQVRLSQSRERLADSRIAAPFDAFVARRYADNHTKVRVGDKVARLSDLNELKVVASLPEQLVATVTPERVVSVTARFDFLPGEHFELTYRENTGEANPVAQTYEVTFTMARSEESNLLPGMTAQVRIELKANLTNEGIVVPTTALSSEPDGRFFVWVFDPATSLVSKRLVSVSGAIDEGVGIASGLADGDLVVAAGASQLQQGMQIRSLGEPGTRL